jgi:zinc/manganese transport system substrate-binding protein
MFTRYHGAALLVALLSLPATAAAQLRVVTSTTDLYEIAREVGGKHITAKHIGEGYQDPHFIEAKPSFVLDLRRADVWAFVGLDLEIGWMPLLLDGARNPKIRMGGSGYLDASRVIDVLDVPTGNVDRSQGDVHALGNPHYWLNPDNGLRIAQLFREKFSELDPSHAADYQANLQAFESKLAARRAGWDSLRGELRGKPIVAYHTSWRYLAAYTGVDIVGFMEPKPGVPPSPSHVAALIETVKRTGAKVIIMEPFYDRKMPDFVAARTGARVLVLPSSVGGVPGVDDYLSLITYDLEKLGAAMR